MINYGVNTGQGDIGTVYTLYTTYGVKHMTGKCVPSTCMIYAFYPLQSLLCVANK